MLMFDDARDPSVIVNVEMSTYFHKVHIGKIAMLLYKDRL